jgi:hypothetical protein
MFLMFMLLRVSWILGDGIANTENSDDTILKDGHVESITSLTVRTSPKQRFVHVRAAFEHPYQTPDFGVVSTSIYVKGRNVIIELYSSRYVRARTLVVLCAGIEIDLKPLPSRYNQSKKGSPMHEFMNNDMHIIRPSDIYTSSSIC